MKFKHPHDYGNLTEKDLLSNNGEIVSWAIDKGTFHKLPKEAITAKVLLQKAIRGPQKGHRLIHIIALVNADTAPGKIPPLKHIPKEVFTHELLSVREDSGETVYHMLAHSHALNYIPQELVTKDSLLLSTKEGRTVLHSLAINSPKLIPKEITLKEMLIKDKNNFTPLHGYSCSNQWANIPKEFLTKESIGIKDVEGKTPADYMIEEFAYDITYRNIKSDPEAVAQIKHVLTLVENISIDRFNIALSIDGSGITLGQESLSTIVKLINQEMGRRQLHKKLCKNEKSIEI
jgi:hypothetical protein